MLILCNVKLDVSRNLSPDFQARELFNAIIMIKHTFYHTGLQRVSYKNDRKFQS